MIDMHLLDTAIRAIALSSAIAVALAAGVIALAWLTRRNRRQHQAGPAGGARAVRAGRGRRAATA